MRLDRVGVQPDRREGSRSAERTNSQHDGRTDREGDWRHARLIPLDGHHHLDGGDRLRRQRLAAGGDVRAVQGRPELGGPGLGDLLHRARCPRGVEPAARRPRRPHPPPRPHPRRPRAGPTATARRGPPRRSRRRPLRRRPGPPSRQRPPPRRRPPGPTRQWRNPPPTRRAGRRPRAAAVASPPTRPIPRYAPTSRWRHPSGPRCAAFAGPDREEHGPVAGRADRHQRPVAAGQAADRPAASSSTTTCAAPAAARSPTPT